MDTLKLAGSIVEHGTTQEQVAKQIGIDRSTFYRKMQNGRFFVDEARAIKKALNLSDEEASRIFLR